MSVASECNVQLSTNQSAHELCESELHVRQQRQPSFAYRRFRDDHLTWDEENQLTQATLPSGVVVNYKYDALGRRIQRTTSAGANERYVYDGNDVLLDLNADWSVATKYLNGEGVDNHLAQTSAVTGVSYYLTDHLGSTAGLTDASGNLVEQLTYDSFGNSSGSTRTRYGYTGRERDPDTGLMYYRARWYDPEVGRFISEDPIGLAGGINLYAYVGNNPIGFNDPLGLCREKASSLAPNGLASDRKLTDEECDRKLSEIFGGKAYAMVSNDIKGRGRGADGHTAVPRNDRPIFWYSDGRRYRYDRGGIIHTYTDEKGSARKDIGLFTPIGWVGSPAKYYDPQSGNSGLRFTYATGLVISFVHVGTDNKNKVPSAPLRSSTAITRIGYVGGFGGEGEGYYHTHIIFSVNGLRVDPRSVFCGF